MNRKYNPSLLVDELTSFMFDSKNLRRFTKHSIDLSVKIAPSNAAVKETKVEDRNSEKIKNDIKMIRNTIYKPSSRDSLFWCFFILKHGFSKYEMEVSVSKQYFTVEKKEKFAYIDLLRNPGNKDLLKMHKIKPLSMLEDDLANQERISVKTFFALCIIENINIMLVDKRKVYEVLTSDDTKIHVVHRNSLTNEHHIELDVLPEKINMYRDTYYNVPNFDANLKSMASYKLDELMDLCKKLNIILEDPNINTKDKKDKKKMSKKDIYELLVQQF